MVRIHKDDIAELQIGHFSLVQLLIWNSERLYICVVICLFRIHCGDSSDVTLAFEDALF